MTSITANELQQFYRFIGDQLEAETVDMSPEDCLDIWRFQHPSPEDVADSIAALKTALEEARRGEGRPADAVLAELRADLDVRVARDSP